MKRCTGIPCPTCGSTRAATHLLSGDITGALALNPLAMLLLLAAPVWLAWQTLAPRRQQQRAPWSASQRAIAWLAALGLLAGNWAYIIARGN